MTESMLTSSPPSAFTLDRRAAAAIAILFALAVFINLDRFAEGPKGLLRAHDLADQTVSNLASCGEFWRSSLRSTWDASQLRGWPHIGSPQNPQTLMCMAAAVMPVAMLMPILHTLLLALIAVGTYLFVRIFLRRHHDTALAGSVLNVTLYFFFHEHPVVPSAILLPSLIGFLSVPVRTLGDRILLFAGAVLVLGLSNPPPTLVLMPLGHLALLFIAPRSERRGHLVRCIVFWLVYGLYYGPTMVAMLGEYSISSRSLYAPGVARGTFAELFNERLFNAAVLSPAAVLIALVSRRTWRGTLLFFAGIIAFVAMTAANQVVVQEAGPRFPILVALSTTYYRMYYFVPVGVLLWAVWLFDDVRDASRATRVRHVLVTIVFCAVVARITTDAQRVFIPFWPYAAVIGALGVTLSWWTRRTWAVLLVVASVFAFGRYEFAWVYEVPAQGNLFVEPARFNQPPTLARTVTVMNDCDAVDLFPAQARVAGEEILDGISNYYSRGFAERWRYYVADNPATCTARYATWGTRTELTLADLTYSADRILPWLWINDVQFVRAAVPLAYPGLTLVDHRAFKFDRTHRVQRYLYRLDAPAGRIFTIPAPLAAHATGGDLVQEEETLYRIQREHAVSSVPVELVNNSHLRFNGDFSAGTAVVANMNYHRGWRLLVDGTPSGQLPSEGPFGMIRLPVASGAHRYELVFTSPIAPLVPWFMIAALGLLWFAAGRSPSADLVVWPWWRPSLALAGAGAALALCGVAALGWMRTRPVAAPWLGGAAQRIQLETAGVPITGPLARLPVRVELGPQDTAFWESVVPSNPGLRVTDSGGQQQLPLEIQEFDPARKRLVIWFQAPRLVTGPQTIGYLYFGIGAGAPPAPSGGVWDSRYAGVWHTPPEEAPAAFTTGDGDWTVDFRVNPDPLNGRNFELLEQGPPGAFNIYLHQGGYLVIERQNGGRASQVVFADAPIPSSTWTHVSIGRTRNHIRVALNGRSLGAQLVVPTFVDPVLPGPLRFGRGQYGPLSGTLSEVRLSRGTARSADWELAMWASEQPGFIRHGTVERAGGAANP